MRLFRQYCCLFAVVGWLWAALGLVVSWACYTTLLQHLSQWITCVQLFPTTFFSKTSQQRSSQTPTTLFSNTSRLPQPFYTTFFQLYNTLLQHFSIVYNTLLAHFSTTQWKNKKWRIHCTCYPKIATYQYICKYSMCGFTAKNSYLKPKWVWIQELSWCTPCGGNEPII